MPRKTVTELNRIKADVSTTREELHNCSETLENLTFDICQLNRDDIRVDEDGYHKESMKLIRSLTRDINKAAKLHAEAVVKYREFFAC